MSTCGPSVVWLLVLSACGGAVAASAQSDASDGADSSPKAAPDADVIAFGEAGAPDVQTVPPPLEDSGVSDEAGLGCATRPAATCPCQEDCPRPIVTDLREMVAACLKVEWTCGFLWVTFDADSCASAIAMEEPSPKFVACLAQKLDAVRFAGCSIASTTAVIRIDSCTVR